MWSDIQILTDELPGNAGPGNWGFAIGPLLLKFYKDVRIIGVQASLFVTNANGWQEALAYAVIQHPTNKGTAIGTFGSATVGTYYYFAVNTGSSLKHEVIMDIPANTDVTIIGSCNFSAVAATPTSGSMYIDILYRVKQFI